MGKRKQQILQKAIEIIANEGYANLGMRALARASGMKLGALQYHFKNTEEMLQGLVDYIAAAYRRSFESLISNDDQPGVREIALFILDDSAGDALLGGKLWPQLWAMELVEPFVGDLLDELYAEYIEFLEQALEAKGSLAPRAEALFLLSLIDGATIFVGSGRRWEADASALRETVLEFIDTRYGEEP
jgi:AcrR family transcriptional regulator